MAKEKEQTPEMETDTTEANGQTSARPQDGEDVNEDNVNLIGLVNTLTVASISCKPQPTLKEDGSVQTIKVGDRHLVMYADQDLFTLSGRATAYDFVETDKGISLELVGEFKAQTIAPDHNGEIDKIYASGRCILPGAAETPIIRHIQALGQPVGMTGDIEVSGEEKRGVKRTASTELKEPVVFAYIIGARQGTGNVGYEYTVRAVQKVVVSTNPVDMMLAAANKKRKILALGAPGSKHAE